MKNPLAGRFTDVVLDYGADVEHCAEDAVEISELGMLVRTRWQFSMGTELAVVLAGEECDGSRARFTVQGIVVWCERLPGREARYESTVLFWEIPAAMRRCLQQRAEAL